MRAREEKSSRYFADDSETGDPFELTSSSNANGRLNTQGGNSMIFFLLEFWPEKQL